MVARDITIDGDPDEVWEALTDPELLAEWLGGDREAVLEEAEPGERLVFWWFEEGEPGSRVELTLARVRDPAGLKSTRLLDGFTDRRIGTTQIDAITLFHSKLSPKGPTYTPLLRTPLTAAGGRRQRAGGTS